MRSPLFHSSTIMHKVSRDKNNTFSVSSLLSLSFSLCHYVTHWQTANECVQIYRMMVMCLWPKVEWIVIVHARIWVTQISIQLLKEKKRSTIICIYIIYIYKCAYKRNCSKEIWCRYQVILLVRSSHRHICVPVSIPFIYLTLK
jgi:hypothetical protein